MVDRFARMGETFAQYKERRKTEAVSTYERRVVRKILAGSGVSRASLALGKHEVEADDEEAYMTISWFAGQYPSFPVILDVREAWTPDIVDFFKVRSRKNSFWAIWNEVTECLRGNRKPIGCVFPFPKVTDLDHGIVHNADLPYLGEDPRDFLCMQRRTVNGEVITLELLTSFINRIRTIWEPS